MLHLVQKWRFLIERTNVPVYNIRAFFGELREKVGEIIIVLEEKMK